MRAPIPSSTPSSRSARDGSALHSLACRAALWAAAIALAGCAHTAPVRPAKSTEPRIALENESLGYRVQLPQGWRFLAGGESDNVIARGEDRVLVRLFPEHFTSEPRPEDCWIRLYERLPNDLESAPESPGRLAERAPSGLTRLGGRRIHFAPFQRDDSCLVLVVEGPADGSAVDLVARTAFESFEPTRPSQAMQTRLDFDAGTQLLERGENEAALKRFEDALHADPSLHRAYLGAGLAASYTGNANASRAVVYLERFLELRALSDSARRARMDADHLRDALMHLGLAYATLKDYPNARARLGELTNRYPDDPIGQYNFACALSLSGDVESALYHLEEAVARDPRLASHARTDEDLVPLRRLPEYERILRAAGAPPTESGEVR